jgi:hypothetical protein
MKIKLLHLFKIVLIEIARMENNKTSSLFDQE